MNKTLWKIVDISWLVTFEMLLATAMKIPLMGAMFIPLLLLFTWFFSRTIPKFGSSWITWAIPYTFSVVLFLGLFVKENLFVFTFKTFWLSLASWFVSPISPFAMAVLLFAISYVMAYLTAHLLENTLNTFIALSTSAAIAGVVTQYCCLPISFAFMLLFTLSLVLNANHKKDRFTKPFVLVIMITIVIGSTFFLIGTYFKPSVPLEHLFTFKTTSTQSVLSNSVAPLAKNNVAVKVPAHGIVHSREIVKNSRAENAMFEMIMDVVGVLIISVGISVIVGMFLFKKKKKRKIRWKKLIYAIWMVSSAFFVAMLMMYTFGMLNFKANRVFTSSTAHMSGKILNSTRMPSSLAATATSLPSRGGTSPITNPIIWITLAVMGLVIILYTVFKFVKDLKPSGEGRKSEEDAEENANFNKPENMNFSGKPWQTVLFYYNLLRDSSEYRSATPSEFEKVLEEKMGVEDAEKVTRIFVKLRYAHNDISEKEAHFVKEQVSRVLVV